MTENTHTNSLSRSSGLEVPENALTVANNAMGWLLETIKSSRFLSMGILLTRGDESVMKSFQNDDYDNRMRFQSPALVGIHGLTEALHLGLRQHVTAFHMRYKDVVLEALSAKKWEDFSRKDVETVKADVEKALATFDSKRPSGTEAFHASLENMLRTLNQALSDEPTRAHKAALFLQLGEISSHYKRIIKTQKIEDIDFDALTTIMQRIDSKTFSALKSKCGLLQGKEDIEFTLLDRKAEPIILPDGKPATISISPNGVNTPTLIDFAIGAVGGKGLLNDKFSRGFQNYGSSLTGNARETLVNMENIKTTVVEALKKAYPNLAEEEINAVLSQSGLNLSPSIRMGLRKAFETTHYDASLEQHICNACVVVDTYTDTDDKYAELATMLGVPLYSDDALLPNTRYHYLRIAEGIKSHLNAEYCEAKSEDHIALEATLKEVELHLGFQYDELEYILPYFHKNSPIQQAPNKAMRDLLEQLIEKTEQYQTNLATRIEGMDTLTNMMQAGLAQGQKQKLNVSHNNTGGRKL